MVFQKGHPRYPARAETVAAEPRETERSEPLKFLSLKIPTRRFSIVDLSDVGVWLLNRLKPQFPHLDQRNFTGWIRSCIESNDFLFIRTNGAVALAEIINRPLLGMRVVEEVFALSLSQDKAFAPEDKCLEDDDLSAHGMALYGEIKNWAVNQGAALVRVDNFSDFDLDVMRLSMGKVVAAKSYEVRFDNAAR